MLFSNQKIFLDVKDYSRIDRLEADIRQFGGIIEKFLSKEITCIVTNRGRVETLLQQKGASKSTQSQSPSLQRSACGSWVMSRGQSLLMRSNSRKDASACDPVTFAQIWGIKTVTLDSVLRAIERQLPTCTPSSPASKQSDKSHLDKKRRKFSGASVKVEDVKSNSQSFVTKFLGSFIKFEDTESHFRPFFHQYSTFPHVDLEGDLLNGIFSCAKNIKPVATRMNVNAPTNTRKQKAWSKCGYCESCDVMYDDLNQHLAGTDHRRFAERIENFADLDKLIDQVQSVDSSIALLATEDNCRCHVDSGKNDSENAEEMQLVNNNSPLTAGVQSASCHNVAARPSESPDHQTTREETDKVVSVVENDVSGEQIGNHSPELVRINSVSPHSVTLESAHAGDAFNDKLHSERLLVHCSGGNILSRSQTSLQSADCRKTDEALCRELDLHNMSSVKLQSRDDGSSEFISSNYVLNLLELLSSEHSVDSALHAQEAERTVEMCGEGHLVNSVAEHCIPTSCNYDKAPELLPSQNEYCQQMSLNAVADKSCWPSLLSQNDLFGHFDTGVVMEQHCAHTDKCTAKNEHLSKVLHLPMLTSVDAALSETLVSANVNGNHSDSVSCTVKVDNGVSVLPLHEVNNNSSYLSAAAMSVDQPAICAATIKTESADPVYADCHVNDVCTFVDGTFLPVPSSDSVADNFDLHDQLLTLAHGPNIVELQHDNQQFCSSVHASADSVDFSTSSNANFCLPLVLGLPLCLSDDSASRADCSDVGLCTPAHSCSDPFEKPSTSAPDNNTLTESTSLYQSSPFPGIISFMRSAQVNDGSLSSIPCIGWQTNSDAAIDSDEQDDECCVQEKQDSQINSYPETKFDETAKCASRHGLEDCYTSTRVGSTQLETTLVDTIASSHCLKSLSNISSFPVSEFSALSLSREKNNNSCVVEPPEFCNTAEPVREADANNDSASTMIYSCDHLTSSMLENISDRNSPDQNKSETTVDHGVSSDSAMWKVISFVDCRMRLTRTEAASASQSIQNNNDVSLVLEPELHDASEPVDGGTGISTMVYSCDCPALSVQEQMITESETAGKPPVSNANSTWKVISFADCRMRLVRTEALFPSSSAQTVSSDSTHWFANNSCNVQFLLSKTPDNVLLC